MYVSGRCGSRVDERIGFGLYQSCGDSVGHVSVLVAVGGEWAWTRVGSGGVMSVGGVSHTSEVHPVFNPVAPYGYLLSDMYLFMADITNPDFLVWSCRTCIGLDITRFGEQ